MEWFRKPKSGISSQEKKNIPEGLWTKCPTCGEIVYSKKMEQLLWVCPSCSYHFRIPSRKYIGLILDGGHLEEFDTDIRSVDPLKFKDSKKYPDRLKAANLKAGGTEGLITGLGTINETPVSFSIMDFSFIGGSMGSVVGEKVARSIERAIDREIPLIIVSCSGGARMQEGILSLMQMAKTSGLLAVLSEKKIPYISVLTHPTTAGVMASYAS
ncbi:acetyl-CoA carboxylase carboxyl transferase subunit beta, partial [candidate division GN15 bacterium]|nr:acetyl-CoA carboxylase carboxyl transferase subunit beta [candidate division GN15 bacterium]